MCPIGTGRNRRSGSDEESCPPADRKPAQNVKRRRGASRSEARRRQSRRDASSRAFVPQRASAVRPSVAAPAAARHGGGKAADASSERSCRSARQLSGRASRRQPQRGTAAAKPPGRELPSVRAAARVSCQAERRGASRSEARRRRSRGRELPSVRAAARVSCQAERRGASRSEARPAGERRPIQSGMLPCLRRGSSSRLVRSMASPATTF